MNYQEALSYIKNHTDISPRAGLILGSGLGDLVTELPGQTVIPYGDIPGFPVSTVAGHKGQFLIGTYRDKPVMVMQGRFHYYEGYEPHRLACAVRVMRLMGVTTLFITNAAGGINLDYQAGDLMAITDHINFPSINPLRGENDEHFGPRFPDMTMAYDRAYAKLLLDIGAKENLPLRQGVYAMMTGPSYETPAEIRMLRAMGADAVGMSTVPEVIAAVHCGMRVAAVSCISNMAAGVLDQPLRHEEVMETALASRGYMKTLLDGFMDAL